MCKELLRVGKQRADGPTRRPSAQATARSPEVLNVTSEAAAESPARSCQGAKSLSTG